MDLEIEFDGDGYLLCYSSCDGAMCGDTWHRTLGEAEEAAMDYFGATREPWRDANYLTVARL
jgi:hypothetical protein